ncbi:MAG: MFS transporter [Cytophagaceae bacterium SCN 52-12]|nr:MAG: MFS transporter [Cytophagaceae bacterium SCN 52-12]
MQTAVAPGFYTSRFWLLTSSSFLFFASFNMLVPELPGYLSRMGGAEYKGHIIALFTITAGISRPFSGILTDKIGRVPVMAIGSLVCVVCGLLYPLLTTVLPFLLLRLAHGFSTGFKPTGTAAYIADIVPPQRRGEALGIHGLCSSLGAAISPACGSWLAQAYSINTMFLASALLALLSVVILLNLRETLPSPRKFSPGMLRLSRRDLFEPAVLAPSVVIFLNYFSFGAVATLTPDFSAYLGFSNLGLFFLVSTLASLISRFVAGRASDRYGRLPAATAGSFLMVAAMIVTAHAGTGAVFLGGGFLYGISMGILSPVLSAWTVDLSNDQNRGRALSTMYLALEAGIGTGAWLSAFLFANQFQNLKLAFLVNAFLAAAAAVYCVVLRYKKELS